MRIIKIREIRVKFTTREIYFFEYFFVSRRLVVCRDVGFIFLSRLCWVDKQMSRKVENNATYEKMLEQAEPRLVRWRNNTRKH